MPDGESGGVDAVLFHWRIKTMNLLYMKFHMNGNRTTDIIDGFFLSLVELYPLLN